MDKLDFQDLPYEEKSGDKAATSAPQEHTVEFSDFPPDATEDESQNEANKANSKPTLSMFSLGFYQQFFDVDTGEVGRRLLSSMLPNPKQNYLEYVIRPKPDLYGPFWVCTTLTFTIAIAGNMANFFQTSGMGFIWKYNYALVSLAGTVIFSYWLVVPLIIWGVLRWRGGIAGYTLTELVCVYGYSLTIFIPCAVLWLIPVPWVRYLLAALCCLLSVATILITLYPAVKNDSKQVMAVFMLVIVVLHAALATGFVLYFFKYTSTSMHVTPGNDIHGNHTAMHVRNSVYVDTIKPINPGKKSNTSSKAKVKQAVKERATSKEYINIPYRNSTSAIKT